jgi:hypothetical protein
VSQGRKAHAVVRLTDGHDAAGLQDRERSRACILQAVSRHTPHARVWIIPGSQVGIDHGTTSQDTARPRTRCPPPHARFAASGARVGHLDHTVDVLPRHTPSQGDGKRRHRGVADASRGPAQGHRLPPQPRPQCLTVPRPRGAQTPARPAHRGHPCETTHTRADSADHSGSPAADGVCVRDP